MAKQDTDELIARARKLLAKSTSGHSAIPPSRRTPADAALIAAAPTLIAELCEALDTALGEVADQREASEQWRGWCMQWQHWADQLISDLGRQPQHGLHGASALREILSQLATAAPGVPRCLCCGCFSTRHEVDDEELRECLDCECEQWENPANE